MNPHDPLLQKKEDFFHLVTHGPILDWWRRQPGHRISRHFGAGPSASATHTYKVEDGDLLCTGAAVVLSKDGIVRHARPWNDGFFCGVEIMFTLSPFPGVV